MYANHLLLLYYMQYAANNGSLVQSIQFFVTFLYSRSYIFQQITDLQTTRKYLPIVGCTIISQISVAFLFSDSEFKPSDICCNVTQFHQSS